MAVERFGLQFPFIFLPTTRKMKIDHFLFFPETRREGWVTERGTDTGRCGGTEKELRRKGVTIFWQKEFTWN